MFLEKHRIGIEMVCAGRIPGGSHNILAAEPLAINFKSNPKAVEDYIP